MNISHKKAKNRKSLIKVLFFDYKLKQKKIAKKLWLDERTIRRYIKKCK